MKRAILLVLAVVGLLLASGDVVKYVPSHNPAPRTGPPGAISIDPVLSNDGGDPFEFVGELPDIEARGVFWPRIP